MIAQVPGGPADTPANTTPAQYTPYRSLFEQIVLTQAAIAARALMEKKLTSPPDKGSNPAEIAENLYKAFIEYHEKIFTYASRYNKRRHSHSHPESSVERVFQIKQLQDTSDPNFAENQQYLAHLKQIFVDFANTCYDNNGQRNPEIDSVKAAATIMQKLYETVKNANSEDVRLGDPDHFVPLRYMRFPVSVLITQLGDSPKWNDINDKKGINFNRGAKPRKGETLKQRFIDAFCASLDEQNEREFKRLHPSSSYIHHPQSFEVIEGDDGVRYRFPCLIIEGRTHLITDTGYLVDRTDELVAHIKAQLSNGIRVDKLVIDFTPPVRDENNPATKHLWELVNTNPKLPDDATDQQKAWTAEAKETLLALQRQLKTMEGAGSIDGHAKVAGKATLVSMDVDLLTGLSLRDVDHGDGKKPQSDTARLSAFIRKHASELRPDVPKDLVAMGDFLPLMPPPEPGKAPMGDEERYISHIREKLQLLRGIAEREIAKENTDATKYDFTITDMVELIEAATPHMVAIAPRVVSAVNQDFRRKKTPEEEEEEKKTPKPGIRKSWVDIKTAWELAAEQKAIPQEPGPDQGVRRVKTPAELAVEYKARFLMTVGGPAAGKSNAEKIANKECDGHYVMPGLDHVRSRFDRQAINLVTDNHNHDYCQINSAGKLVRAMVLERARKQGYHVLLDGSGVPYEGRFDAIVAAFKDTRVNDHRYHTSVLGFDREFFVYDPKQRAELDQRSGPGPRMVINDASHQQGIRLTRERRAMPLDMITTNYAKVPEALLRASQDPNVDRFWLLDTTFRMASNGTDFLDPRILSFTTEISKDQLSELDKLNGVALKDAMIRMADENRADPNREAGNKKIRRAMDHKKHTPKEMPGEAWDFKVINQIGNKYRIEVITDANRYLATLAKGLLNVKAKGPEELFKQDEAMGFDVEGLFRQDNAPLTVQHNHDMPITSEWPVFHHATPYYKETKGISLDTGVKFSARLLAERATTGSAASAA